MEPDGQPARNAEVRALNVRRGTVGRGRRPDQVATVGRCRDAMVDSHMMPSRDGDDACRRTRGHGKRNNALVRADTANRGRSSYRERVDAAAGTRRALCTLRTLWARCTGRAGRTGWTHWTCRSHGPGSAGLTPQSLRPWGPCGPCAPAAPGGPWAPAGPCGPAGPAGPWGARCAGPRRAPEHRALCMSLRSRLGQASTNYGWCDCATARQLSGAP